jgi:hypothetical protein
MATFAETVDALLASGAEMPRMSEAMLRDLAPGGVARTVPPLAPIDLSDACAVCGSSDFTGESAAHWYSPSSAVLVAWGCGPEHNAIIEAARDARQHLTRAAARRLDARKES